MVDLENDGAIPSEPDEPAVGTPRQRWEAIRERLADRPGDPELLTRLARCELDLGNREAAARLLHEATVADPRAEYPRMLYDREFSPEEMSAYNLGLPPIPLSRSIPELLRYPFSGSVRLTLVLLTVLVLVFQLLGLGIVANLLFMAHFTMHLRHAALGRPGDPGPVEGSFGFLWPFLAALAASVAPAAVLNLLWPNGVSIALIWIMGIFLFPACLTAATLLEKPLAAFDYFLIFRALTKIFPEYLLVQGLFFALFIGQGTLVGILDVPAPLSWFVPLIADFALVFALTVSARATGWLYYTNQKRLGWFD